MKLQACQGRWPVLKVLWGVGVGGWESKLGPGWRPLNAMLSHLCQWDTCWELCFRKNKQAAGEEGKDEEEGL